MYLISSWLWVAIRDEKSEEATAGERIASVCQETWRYRFWSIINDLYVFGRFIMVSLTMLEVRYDVSKCVLDP